MWDLYQAAALQLFEFDFTAQFSDLHVHNFVYM